jgi:hypothetical protein
LNRLSWGGTPLPMADRLQLGNSLATWQFPGAHLAFSARSG